MRKFLRKLLTVACLLCIAGLAQAQADYYNASGYFFHPAAPRALNLTKAVTQVGPNTFKVGLGDLGEAGYNFYFNIDASNHLVNWVPVDVTPAGSGFMTADNPGNTVYQQTPQQLGYSSAIYNNTYDPATKTFYIHYGYSPGGTVNDQATFTRQVYEKYTLTPRATVTSVTPVNITEGTFLTIKGTNLTSTTSVILGNYTTLNALIVVSDSVITGVVGKGESGPARVITQLLGEAKTPYLFYTPPPVAIYPWRFVGPQGFSPAATGVNIAAGPNNIPYVVFIDLLNGHKATVMKLVNGNWAAVGAPVSDGGCASPTIVLDKSNIPWVAYIDSVNGNKLTVKKFSGGSWGLIGTAGFAANIAGTTNPVPFAIDTTNKPYILVAGTDGQVNALKYTTAWTNVGPGAIGFKPTFGVSITIDKATNKPYIAGNDAANNNQIAIQKFESGNWVNVGTQGFTTAVNGVFYPEIRTDSHGTPFIAMQEDNGPEEGSVYAYKNGAWAPVGNKFFTGPHIYNISLAVDTAGTPSVLFTDNQNYQQGSVMQPNPNNDGTWQALGQRGFITSSSFKQESYIITSNNIKYIAFNDRTKGGRVTVMQYFVPVPPVITSFLPTTGAQGDTITVKGQNFIGATASSFGGVATQGATILSDSVALLVVGTGANGAVSITTPAGTATKAGFLYCRPVTPSVSIVSSPVSPICAGTPVKFTATAVNGGTTITYQWKKNNKNVGTNNRIYNDSSLANNDSVWCIITGNAPCATSPTAASNVVKYVVNPVLNPAVTLMANPGTTICAGTPVVFTALGTSLGDSVTYQWKKNGKIVGINQSTYADTLLKTGDSVWVVVKIYSPCATIRTITTGALKFTVNPVLNPSVAVAVNPGNVICVGTRVTFTATPANAGDTIVYKWMKNSKKVGTASAVYTDSLLKNNDTVWVVMTVNAACVTTNTVNSAKVILTVNPNVKPTVTLTSTPGTAICSGMAVTFTAATTNAGATPAYQWKKNNINVGTNSNQYVDNRLATGDSVFVVVTATPGACAVPNTVSSRALKFTVTPSVTPSVTVAVAPGNNICAATKVSFTATAVNGGNHITYQWRKNGIATGLNKNTYLDSTLANGDKVTCTITGNATCRVSDTAISAPVVFTVTAGAPAAPTAITGKASVTAGQAGLTYSVPAVAGVTYNWVVPAGATITAGQGTRLITVTWGNTTGDVTIQLGNICGMSPVVAKTVKVTAGLAANDGTLTALLYPNPASSQAHLQLSGYHGQVAITITDMAGKAIKAKTLQQNGKISGTQQFLLQLDNLSAGMYIVTVKDGVTVRSFKLVKAK